MPLRRISIDEVIILLKRQTKYINKKCVPDKDNTLEISVKNERAIIWVLDKENEILLTHNDLSNYIIEKFYILKNKTN